MTHEEIWQEAHDKGIILVPFGGDEDSHGEMCAAISEDLLEAVLIKLGKDPDSWDDVWSLELGFFVEHAAPGTGDTQEESYREALKAYDELNMRHANTQALSNLNVQP